MSRRVYGIDLGTSTSAVAYADRHGVHLVPAIGGEGGTSLTPSAVHVGDDGSVLVGSAALTAYEIGVSSGSAGRLFRYFKRDIGHDVPSMYLECVGGLSWDPVCLSAMVLRKLQLDVAAGHKALEEAVITHPQHFYMSAKNATVEAAKLVGIDVALTVSEPMAAAVSRGYGESGFEGLLMVFDIGGGTLDVNLVKVARGDMRVIGGYGHPHLGGVDFDKVVHELFDQAMVDHHGRSYAEGTDEEKLCWDVSARETKEAIQSRPSFKAHIRSCGCYLPFTLQDRTFDIDVRCQKLVHRISETVDLAFKSASCRWDDVGEVLLVGGSARLRVVRDWLGERSGDRLKLDAQPDLAVARGAALIGFQIAREGAAQIELNQESLDDARDSVEEETSVSFARTSSGIGGNFLPRNLGVLVTDPSTNAKRPFVMVHSGTPIPCVDRRTFRTTHHGATEVEIEVVELDQGLVDDWQEVGRCYIRGLPRGLGAGTPVEVEFNLNLGGGLEVTARTEGIEAKVDLSIGFDDVQSMDGVVLPAESCRRRVSDVPIRATLQS